MRARTPLTVLVIGLLASISLAGVSIGATVSECDPQAEVVTRIDNIANTTGLLTCRAYEIYNIDPITVEDTAEVKFIAGDAIAVTGELQVVGGAIFSLNVAPIPWSINDTGATKCTNETEQMIDCPIATHPNQDGEFGRDFWSPDPSDGHAGFSFTKLDSNGLPLPANDPDWACIYDRVTNMVWEKKTDDGGLQDMDNTYSWYNPDSTVNAGFPGEQNGGDCTGDIDCDTLAYAEEINAQQLCGLDNWRLPTQRELLGIARTGDLGGSPTNPGFMPAFESSFFPNTNYNVASPRDSRYGSYWTSMSFGGGTPHAYYVNFGVGESGYAEKDGNTTGESLFFVRLVTDSPQ